jgi:hypothetical protein
MEGWPSLGVANADQSLLHQNYQARHRALETELGLRLPPLSPEEATQAWPDLRRREILLEHVARWLAGGQVNPTATQKMVEQTRRQVEELRQQLEGHPQPAFPTADSDRLDVARFLLEAVDYLGRNRGFTSAQAQAAITAPLQTEIEALEISLGLSPAPPTPAPPSPPSPPAPQHPISPAPAPLRPSAPAPPSPPAPPPTPLPERLWRSLLSERTLHAILFLGIFLLFSAALSFVIWGWQDFSPLLRVAIPTGFTGLFFGLGWLVRAKTSLYRSGLALSAIAALLIPIDFYTIYVNFHVPPQIFPTFWLVTSLLCLIAYTMATLSIQSRLFGYLVGAAAGSAVLALIELGHQWVDLSLDWRTAGLSVLAAALLFTTRLASLAHTRRWRAFADPFRTLAVMSVAVIMPLTFAWRFINYLTYDTMHTALAVNWWVGGLIFAWGAIFHRSRSLGLLTAISLPVAVYLAQAGLFNAWGTNPAWHAFGWAWLTPLYFAAGRRLQGREDDVLRGHGRTAAGWGVALVIAAALWALTDLTNGAAAAATHAVLAAAVVLAAWLWQRPRLSYGASLLALSSVTFGMTELNLTLPQLSVGWTSLVLAHVVLALNLSRAPAWAGPVAAAGYAIAGLALLPPLLPYDGHLLAYALGHWLGLTAWGARLAHINQPGFTSQTISLRFWSKTPPAPAPALFHWLTAIPLPVWLWLLFVNRRPPDAALPLALAALAWAMVMLGYRLAPVKPAYRYPWHVMGGIVSIVAVAAAFAIAPHGFVPSFTLLAVGLLYLADAVMGLQAGQLAVGGLVVAWGWVSLLNRFNAPFEAVTLGLATLHTAYILAGLLTERRRSARYTQKFLTPLYLAAHFILFVIIWRILLQPFNLTFSNAPWTNTMRLWAAASLLLTGSVVGLYAWGAYKERWGHVAAWLGAAAGGLIAISYSTGRGSSAAKAALIAVAFVLAERGLHALRRQRRNRDRRQAVIRLAWPLYRRPLLAAGWGVSAMVIGLALVRNLWLLGGGREQQIWAAAGLLIITALYALSARLFRQARFGWLAALLLFAPWTILTNLGWFTIYRPTLPGFALSWLALAWALFGLGLWIQPRAGWAYALPLFTVAHILTPFSLLWGVANADTGRFTAGLAVALYGLAAWLDHRRGRAVVRQAGEAASERVGEAANQRIGESANQHRDESPISQSPISALKTTKFLYPALALIPLWAVYLLAWLLPPARHEHYGLMLLAFGPLGLAVGQWLRRQAPHPAMVPAYARPAYLVAYAALIIGTLLTAHINSLLVLVLLFDTLLLAFSAWLFRQPLWSYLAAALTPLALLVALHEAGVPANRHGWWLLGLAAVYLALAWTLRRLKLPAYAAAPLTAAFALIALGLPPSSQDQTGALWGYGAAALFYAVSAFWLGQPLLLTPAAALTIVPYAIGLQKSTLLPPYYGLALYPGAVAALALAWALDRRYGPYRHFPWDAPARWPAALAERLTGWWALPLYALGFGLAAAGPLFTDFRPELTAVNFALLVPVCGWAVARFRLRGWLLAAAAAGQLAAVYYLDFLGWWRYPAWAWLRFLPVTLLTAGLGLTLEIRHREGSPLAWNRWWPGRSRPLYALAFIDITLAQTISLSGTWAGAAVSLGHALLLGGLAAVWRSAGLVYLGLLLGLTALLQGAAAANFPAERLPVALAQLALGYGAGGYGLALARQQLANARQLKPWLAVWELPLQRFSLGMSCFILLLAGWLGLDIVGWTIRALVGLPFRQIVDRPTVQMAVGVLSLLGLLYVAAAAAHRWLRLGYVALAMLLAGWMLHAFYIQQWDRLARVQWYAIPAGLYLLGVGFLEWRQGHKTLGRWLDYAAMLLMLGSLFWQTMLFGWGYAMLLGAEGFTAFWWGSARRLRRFFYAGMVGVMLATLGQLINSLRSVNQWIVFGLIGLLLVALAVLVERKLDEIKAWQDKILETWE